MSDAIILLTISRYRDTMQVRGELPRKALEMVLEWSAMHKDELLKIWETQEFITLSPLE